MKNNSVSDSVAVGKVAIEPKLSYSETFLLIPHYYDMTHAHRGLAIIFNHFKFDSRQYRRRCRYGTEVDRERLRKTFLRLKFKVEIHDDLTRHKLGVKLKEAADRDHENSDCIVINVLSHGDDGWLAARDNNYEVEELMEPFLKSRSLAGKPKLIFIQACRGNKVDPGRKAVSKVSVPLRGDVIDSKPAEPQQSIRLPIMTAKQSQSIRTSSNTAEQPQCYRIPSMADLLVMYSTYQGYYAWRHGQRGSYFIQALCDELDENGTKEDLFHLLTSVSRKVAFTFQSDKPDDIEMHGMKQMPNIVSMLTKNLRFTQGNEKELRGAAKIYDLFWRLLTSYERVSDWWSRRPRLF